MIILEFYSGERSFLHVKNKKAELPIKHILDLAIQQGKITSQSYFAINDATQPLDIV